MNLPVGSEGVDYAWARPDTLELHRLGKKFACRYLAFLPNGKVLASSEREQLHNAGIDIVLNWEQAAGDMLRGYTVGNTQAREALRQYVALGAPSTVPIYFSCDTNVVNATQMDAVRRYLDGARDILGYDRVGVYGQYSVIEALVGPTCKWGWQTYAWSAGKVSQKAHIYQYRNGVTVAGGDCDLNRTLKSEIGAWTMSLSADEHEDLKWLAARGEAFAELRDTYKDTAGVVWPHKGVQMLKSLYALLNTVDDKADAVLARPPLTESQVSELAQHLAEMTDAHLIEQSLRNVLVKGTDDV